MTLPRVLYSFIPGFIFALGVGAVLLGFASPFEPIALTAIDIIFGMLGVVVSAMTGLAGFLVVCDARTDVEIAQAWQDINADVAAVSLSAQAAPARHSEAFYAAGEQDEGLRSILLAHRFDVPRPPPNDTEHHGPVHQNETAIAAAQTNRARPKLDAPNASIATAATFTRVRNKRRIIATNHAARLKALNANHNSRWSYASDVAERDLSWAMPAASKARLVANARLWSAACCNATSHRKQNSTIAADVIFLADRKGRDVSQGHYDDVSHATAPAQLACRDPPLSDGQGEPEKRQSLAGGTSRGEELRQSDGAGELIVVDNFCDSVPICAPELDVIEAYLNDVITDLVPAADSEPDTKSS